MSEHPHPTPSEEYIRAHGREYKKRGENTSARWFVLDGIAYHSRALGHWQVSKQVPGSETWKLHLVEIHDLP